MSTDRLYLQHIESKLSVAIGARMSTPWYVKFPEMQAPTMELFYSKIDEAGYYAAKSTDFKVVAESDDDYGDWCKFIVPRISPEDQSDC